MTTASQLLDRLRGLASTTEEQLSSASSQLVQELRRLADDVEQLLSTQTGAAESSGRPALDAEGADAQAVTNDDPGTAAAASTQDADPAAGPSDKPRKRSRHEPRPMDFAAYRQRYVALELAYVGWGCGGFARQDTCENTIEGHFFKALHQARLVPEGVGWKALQYSRCGRTDKGVSALGQVVALRLRSSAKVAATEAPAPEDELDYVAMLNSQLPDTVRVLGWADVTPEFSARFSSNSRQYKYWVVQRGDLDLGAMRAAGAALVGHHDFRNFCRADVENVRSFERHILDLSIEPAGAEPAAPPSPTLPQLLVITIRGTAFLWHQVRCLVAILVMVGRGQEEVSIVPRLLDIAATPCKPQYFMADEEPLLLHAATFREPMVWQRRRRGTDSILEGLRSAMERHMVGAAMVSCMQERLQGDMDASSSSGAVAVRRQDLPRVRQVHVPLLKRQMEPSVEERLARKGLPPLRRSGEQEEDSDAMAE